MNIFFSWSGDLSKNIAEYFSKWLPCVLQSVKPFFSPEIPKGSRWPEEIADELQKDSHCLIFLTRENINSKYLHFEAGAISKYAQNSKVMTILIDLVSGDIEPPLNIFQNTIIEKKDIYILLSTINKELSEPLSDEILREIFETYWPKLEDNIKIIMSSKTSSKEPIRTDRELLYEILELTRNLSNIQKNNEDRELCINVLNGIASILIRQSLPIKSDTGYVYANIISLLDNYGYLLRPEFAYRIKKAYRYIKHNLPDDFFQSDVNHMSSLYMDYSKGYSNQSEIDRMVSRNEMLAEQQRNFGAISQNDITKEQLTALDLKQRQDALGAITPNELLKEQLAGAKLGIPESQKMQDAALAGASLQDEVMRKQANPGLPPMQDSISQQMKEAETAKLKDAYTYDKAAELSRQNELDKMAQKPDIRLSQQLKQEMAMPTNKEMIEEQLRNKQQAQFGKDINVTMTDKIKDLQDKNGYPPK